MYMEPISNVNVLGGTQTAAQQQVTAKASASSQKQTFKEELKSASKADKAGKPESGDGLKGLQVSKEPDESVTLSIQTDKQLVDEQKNVDMEKLRKILEKMAASLPNSDAKFGFHQKTNRVTIKLVDKDTQEVIKEFPPEKSLDMLAKRLAIAGILVDERL